MLNSLLTFDLCCVFLPSYAWPPCPLYLHGMPCGCDYCERK
jgi:hypothetical protein